MLRGRGTSFYSLIDWRWGKGSYGIWSRCYCRCLRRHRCRWQRWFVSVQFAFYVGRSCAVHTMFFISQSIIIISNEKPLLSNARYTMPMVPWAWFIVLLLSIDQWLLSSGTLFYVLVHCMSQYLKAPISVYRWVVWPTEILRRPYYRTKRHS